MLISIGGIILDISVCIITKNEADKLEKCLLSLKKYNLEIVVVDTGSTDNTSVIIDKYADISGSYKWCDDFSKARNYSISLAGNDWILVLDSDEWIEKMNIDEVAAIISNQSVNCTGKIELINNINYDNELTRGVERITRLFNRKQCHYEGRIHEQVVSIDKNVVTAVDVPITVSHSGYMGSVDNKKKKAERNIRLLELELKENGPDAYIYYQLGKSYYMQGDYKNASVNFEKGLSFDLDPKLEYVQDMVETYGYSLLNEKRIPEMMFLQNIYSEFAVSADYVFLMGLAYMNNGLFDKAIEEFNKAKLYKLCKIDGCNSYKADYNIGVIYECLGDTAKAVLSYKKCQSYEPALKGLKRLGCN